MITVHHLNNSRSQRILWLLEELNLEYDLKLYQRGRDLLAPRALREIHPLGKAPILTEGDRVVVESAVILEYLLDRHGGGLLRPTAGSPAFERYRYWLHYAEGSLMSPLLLNLVFSNLPKQPMPIIVRPIASAIAGKALTNFVDPQVKVHLDYIEAELGRTPWFAGPDFTAADVQMSFPVEAAAARTKNFSRAYPNLKAFIDRIRARPAYARAEARGGKFSVLN